MAAKAHRHRLMFNKKVKDPVLALVSAPIEFNGEYEQADSHYHRFGFLYLQKTEPTANGFVHHHHMIPRRPKDKTISAAIYPEV